MRLAAALLLLSLPARAAAPQDISLDALTEAEASGLSASCSLVQDGKIILRSDWSDKVWIKVGGKIEELHLEQAPEEGSHPSRWRATFHSSWGTVALDLKMKMGGAETATLKGTVTATRGKNKRKLKVTGGCAT